MNKTRLIGLVIVIPVALGLVACPKPDPNDKVCTAEEQVTTGCKPEPGFGVGEYGSNGDQNW